MNAPDREQRNATQRAIYRVRRDCDLHVGDVVRTPMGLEAKITGFGSDGRVHLRYEERSDLVVLKPELLSERLVVTSAKVVEITGGTLKTA